MMTENYFNNIWGKSSTQILPDDPIIRKIFPCNPYDSLNELFEEKYVDKY